MHFRCLDCRKIQKITFSTVWPIFTPSSTCCYIHRGARRFFERSWELPTTARTTYGPTDRRGRILEDT